MTILVIAEHNNSKIKASTLNTVAAAKNIGGEIHILVAGANCGEVATQASNIDGISTVLKADAPHLEHHLAENLSALIVENADKYSHILAPGSTFGKNVMPRVAALLDVQQVSDVIEVINESTFKHPVYGGQAIATVESTDGKKVLTVRTTGFDAVPVDGGSASIEDIITTSAFGLSSFVSIEESKSERPELGSAKIVISGGRGVGSKEDFKIIEDLADKLGGAVGASRAAVDAGYVPNDYQVGQTGKVVAPNLYMAIGISGAIQHLAGMKDSKVIVAINKDEEAPIFQVADYGLVADLFDAVPELIKKL